MASDSDDLEAIVGLILFFLGVIGGFWYIWFAATLAGLLMPLENALVHFGFVCFFLFISIVVFLRIIRK